MPRHLIVNADDFGLTIGVVQGIIHGHREGIVTSASVMINMPDAAEAVALALREAPTLGLGLHLNLTCGPPIADPREIPDLLQDNETFYPKHTVTASLPTLDMRQVEAEMRAQIVHFSRVVGHPPDHLDSHHHITYLSPPMIALMAQLSRDLGVPVRYPIPSDQQKAIELLLDINAAPHRAAAEEMLEVLRSTLRQAQVRTPDNFISRFYGPDATLGTLLNILVSLPKGTSELMCHPGIVDSHLHAISGYTDKRQEELAALTYPSTREAIKAEEIELITFGDLPA